MMTDYREDGMDLGSDASSRSSSESNSNKVTPCSPSLDLATLEDYKSSPSLDLVTLEDYEEDEDYQEYKKKVIEEWESEYGEGLHLSTASWSGGSRRSRRRRRRRRRRCWGGHSCSAPPVHGVAQGLLNPATAAPAKAGGAAALPGVVVVEEEAVEDWGTDGGYKEDEVVEEEPLPTMDWAALERHLAGLQCREQENQNLNHNQNHIMGKTNYTSAQKNERESIRQKLALGSFFDDGPGIYTSCSKSGKPSLSSRLQSGMNLQICFVNDSGSDKDSDADDSKTETSLDTPLSPMSKQSSSYSDRDTTEDDSESLEDMDFVSRQKKLQAEAKLALAMAKPMAKMQVEVEKQNRKKSPVADLLPHMPHISECLMKRSLKPTDLRDMTLGQLQVIVNDLHSQIETLNEELVQLLLIRDELHMEQDAMLVDIEDLTRHAESQQKHLAERTLSK
ncbi:hypothetical protein KUCAC02_005806 [Chaenocephalus aceratus]|uniref:Uncharacterized protein n=1 Tax=Chaenocephalus aceratus TaxID=36190 RepID=A0ACB9WR62_CHAAC|nr:hypothetical protein KUCAC02_005806 [Chaenocephalus aceratus]